MNRPLIQNLAEAEELSHEILSDLWVAKEESAEIIGGELLKYWNQGLENATSLTENLHNQVLTLYAQAKTEL